MGKLLAQHLQNIITVLCYILLLESQELKADIFPFHDLKTFINLITPAFVWFSSVAISGHLCPQTTAMKVGEKKSIFNTD